MRFFVHFSGDETMAAAINDDIHLTVAAEIYDKPKEEITSEQRKRAKGTNFGIIYGSGAATQAETLTKKGLPTTIAESTVFVNKYHRKFPSVRRTTKRFGIELKEFGFVTNPFGRRYHIPHKFAYKLLNYMCQGTSADLMKRGMVEIWEWLRATNKISRLILTVHDELVFECPRFEEQEVIAKACEIMEELTMFKIPMTVSVDVVAKRWSEKLKPKDLGFNFN
jgi:DNA polymerase-1